MGHHSPHKWLSPMFSYVVLITLCVILFTTTTVFAGQYCGKTVGVNDLLPLQRVTFNNVNNGGSYQFGEGVTLNSAGFSMRAPAGSATFVNFNNKVNLRSGFVADFTYSFKTSTSSSRNNGFAFVIQSISPEAREGSNQWLGYRNTKTIAFEFDYYKDTTDLPVPHIMVAEATATAAANAQRLTSCTAGTGCNTLTSTAVNTANTVNISILPTGSSTTSAPTYKIVVTHTVSGTERKYEYTTNLLNVLDGAGMAYVGFTTSASDATDAYIYDITQFKASTGGVKSLQLATSAVPTSRVSDTITAVGAYDIDAQIQDQCGVEYRQIGEEVLAISEPQITGFGAFQCVSGPLTPAVQNRGANPGLFISYRLRQACKLVTNARVGTFAVKYGNTQVSVSMQAQFVATEAVARTSKIVNIRLQSGTVLCSSAADCNKAIATSVVAGNTFLVTVETQDEFGNPATGAFSTVRLAPTEGTRDATASSTQTSVTVSFEPQKVTPAAGSALEVTINSQLLTSATTIIVVPAQADGSLSSVIAGTGLSQYGAGETHNFKLQLKDRFGNVATATTSIPITFGLKYNTTACATSTGTAFAQTCPWSVVSGEVDQVQFSSIPKLVGQYELLCTVNGATCQGMTGGYSITVVPARENVKNSYFKRRNLPIWDYPTTTTNAGFKQVMAADFTLPTTSSYATVGSSAIIDIQVADEFGNPRTTQNTGDAFDVVVSYGATSSVISCSGTAPATSTLFTAASRCEFSTQNGYVLSLFPTKVSYFDKIAADTSFKLQLRKKGSTATTGDDVSTAKSFFLVQTPTADKAKTVVTRTPSGTVVAGTTVTWNVKVYDTYGNAIIPLWTGGSGDAVEPNRSYLKLALATTSSSASLNPDSITDWKWDATKESWAVSARLRGAVLHTVRVAWKSTDIAEPAQGAVEGGDLLFTPTADIPFSASPRVEVLGTADNKVSGTMRWTLYDQWGNLAIYQSAQVAGITATAISGSDSRCVQASPVAPSTTICNANDSVCTANIVLTPVSVAYTCVYTLAGTPTGLKQYPLATPPVDLNTLTVPVPKDTTVNVAVSWAKQITDTDYTTVTYSDSQALTLTAGDVIHLKFISQPGTGGGVAEPLDPTQLVVTFSKNNELVMPGSSIPITQSAATTIYASYTITTSGLYIVKAQYGITPGKWGATATQSPQLTVVPDIFAIQQSFTTAPSSLVACDDVSKLSATENVITVSPYDRFGNQLNDITNPADPNSNWFKTKLTWFHVNDDNTRVVLTADAGKDYSAKELSRDAATNTFAYQLCKRKSDYWKFAYSPQATTTAPAASYSQSFTQVKAAAPEQLVFDGVANCQVQEDCSLSFKVNDKYANPITKDELDALGGVFTARIPAIAVASQKANFVSVTGSETGWSDADYQSATSFVVRMSDQTGTVSIVKGELKTLTAQQQLTLTWTPQTGTALTKAITINLSQLAIPSYYVLKMTSTPSRFITSHRYVNPDLTPRCTSQASCDVIPGETSVDNTHRMDIEFYDAYFNVWTPALGTNFGGTMILDQTTVALISNQIIDGAVYSISPRIITSGTYYIPEIVVNSARLPGFKYTTVPGSIKRWTFSHPDFGLTKAAGTSFTIKTTPYDANNNIVTDKSLVEGRIPGLKLKVFEGSYTCTSSTVNGATTYNVQKTTSGGTSEDVTALAQFVPGTAVAIPATGEWQIPYTTTRAGSLAVSGNYLQYTYFISEKATPESSTEVLSCAQATITYIPNQIAESKAELVGLDKKKSAIEVGAVVNFNFTLYDNQIPPSITDKNGDVTKFVGNPIAYFDGDNAPTIEVYACNADNTKGAVLCSSGNPNAANSCLIEPINSKQAASITFDSSKALIINSNELSFVRFGIFYRPSDRFNTVVSNADITFPCQEFQVHHSYPKSIYLEEDEILANNTVVPKQPDTIVGGIPHEFKLWSRDHSDTTVDFSNSAFQGEWYDFERFPVNTYRYIVEARIDSLTSLTYATSNTSSVIVDPLGKFQSVWLTPAWAGKYTLSARLVHTVDNKTFTEVDTPITWSSRTLMVTSPICPEGTVYKPSATEFNHGTCVAATATDVATFTCTGANGSVVTGVTYANVNEKCECYAKDNSNYVKVKNGDVARCTSNPDAFENIDFTGVVSRVCPANYHLCGDLTTCVEAPNLCPAITTCTGFNEVQCFDGSCAVNAIACGSEYVCPKPTEQVLCPNNQCISNGAGNFCQQVRECNYPAHFRCPSTGVCVASPEQCPSNTACPTGSFKCDNGQCVEDITACPVVPPVQESVAVIPTCSAERPYLCADKTCAVDSLFCPTLPSCGNSTNAQILCPDLSTCVDDVALCTLVSDEECPAGQFKCASNGKCIDHIAQCPAKPTCPAEAPIKCATTGRCVSVKDSCDDGSAQTPLCSGEAPVRCPSGKCVKSDDLCESLIVCPFFKPVLCSTGECVAAIELCRSTEEAVQCPDDHIACPLTGTCVQHLAFCPTVRTCPDNYVRCPNGECYPIPANGIPEDQTDICPSLDLLDCSTKSFKFFDEKGTLIETLPGVQCPITNTGVICRAFIKDCPTDTVCPAATPIRCGDARCVSDIAECDYNFGEVPDKRWACGLSAWSSSQRNCGTPATCPPHAPVQCLDGSCVKYLSDCTSAARPSQLECTADRPFKCPDGSCQLNAWSCSMPNCLNEDTPIRCPAHGATTRCVAKLEQCPMVYDSSAATTVTQECQFGQRCSDGTCVVEGRLCPNRSCPNEASYLCPTGVCAKNAFMCPTTQGCPFDLPFYCKFTAGCVASEKACNALKSQHKPTAPKIIVCPTYEETDADTGAIVVKEMFQCEDGSCRKNQDECYLTGPFNCPVEKPVRCGNGECVIAPIAGSSSDADYRCKTNTADYNACPVELPVRCPGGLCTTSLSRCPMYSQANDQTAVCRKSKIATKIDYLRNKVDDWETQDMKVTCDDGSCAFSLAECPTITPCAKNQIRCGDGSCRDLPFDPTNIDGRAKMQSLDYMGANCPAMVTPTKNKCPIHVPYLCQSGECAVDSSQCQSNWPFDLRPSNAGSACCGSGANAVRFEMKNAVRNPQGELVGVCQVGTSCTIDSTDDASRYRDREYEVMGCPFGMFRCASGFCVDTDRKDTCNLYDQFFEKLNTTTSLVTRAPYEENGCPSNTPKLCPNGECVSKDTTCPAETDCELGKERCADGRCVIDKAECNFTPKGCPMSSPVLCASGECKTAISSQQGVTMSSSSNGPINGISPLVCPLTLACSNPLFPVLCGDGSCVVDSKYCPPIVVRCGQTEPEQPKPTKENPYPEPVEPTGVNICRFACPFTLECVGVPFVKNEEGVETNQCDWSQLPTVCPNVAGAPIIKPDNTTIPTVALTQCPGNRPTLCANGLCAESLAQCSSPFYDEARTFKCTDPVKPYQCYDGKCAADPFGCVNATAVANGFAELKREQGITGSNVCKSSYASYVCPNGLCVANAAQCGVFPSCPAGALRCRTGTCALSSMIETVNSLGVVVKRESIEPKCEDDPETPGEAYTASCEFGFTRCADGTCRQQGTCPMTSGCPADKPFHCAWRSSQPCTTTAAECSGFQQEEKTEGAFMLQSSSTVQTTTSFDEATLSFLEQRFPQLDVEQYRRQRNPVSTKEDAEMMRLAQATTTRTVDFVPNENFVESCWKDCERSIMATQSTVILTPSSGISNLVVSANEYAIPRTTLSIPAQATSSKFSQMEFSVYPTPQAVFDGQSTTNKQFYTPYTWSSTKKAPSQTAASADFSAKVISTPFACEVKYNHTSYARADKKKKGDYKLLQPITVSAYVDTSFYQQNGAEGEKISGPDAVLQTPCPYIGEYDSALMGQRCGGQINITSTTLSVSYEADACKWPVTPLGLNQTQFSFNATFTRAIARADPTNEKNSYYSADDFTQWNEAEAKHILCWKITSGTKRTFKLETGQLYATPIKGYEFCAKFERVTDVLSIAFPDNFLPTPNQLTQTTNELTPADFLASTNPETAPVTTNAPATTLNVRLYGSTQLQCDPSTDGPGTIQKKDICLGAYRKDDMRWRCIHTSYEDRNANPAWKNGMNVKQVKSTIDDSCAQNAYAFLYVTLPPPSELKESFCWFCKYGWIILVVGIIFVVVLLIVIILVMKFMADRVKYKEEQAKLKGLQEAAQDLQENQGGLGVADADQEIVMSLNPLVLQLQDLNQQLEKTNEQLGSQAKEEEYHIQRLQAQRVRIKAEIQRLEEEMQKTDAQSNKAKRIDDKPTTGPGNMMPAQGAQLQLAGPVRAGGNNGPSGPSPAGGNLTGPMRVNNNR